MSLPRYAAYKDSGVEWLGDIPEHWSVLRLKHACHVFPSNVDKKSVEGEAAVRLCNYTDVYYNDRIGPELDFMVASATADQIEKFTLRAGDTIITKDSETADDIAVSAYVPDDLPGVICGYHLSVVRPAPPHVGAFVKRLFDSVFVKACVAVRANGLTRVALGQYDLDNLELPFPPSEEQAAIAPFLDREIAKIDALVEEQNRLIALLGEKRQATISHAVTKGLNPDAPLTPSAVEWLGPVPRHWRVARLSYYSSIENGTTPAREQAKYWFEGAVPWLSSGAVNQGRIDSAQEFITATALNECSLRLLPPGTVVVGLIGQGRTRGLAALLQIEATINQNLAAVVPRADLDSEYLYFALTSMYEFLREHGRGGNQAAINSDILAAAKIAVPPLREQLAVSQHLRKQIAAIDGLVAEAQHAVEYLFERRAALITDAVTGQIDVRSLAPSEAP